MLNSGIYVCALTDQWHRVTGRAPGKNFQKCVKGSWSYITGCKLWPVPHFEHFFFSVSQTARGDGCHRRRQADRTDPDLGGTEGGGENMAELRFMICFNLFPLSPLPLPPPLVLLRLMFFFFLPQLFSINEKWAKEYHSMVQYYQQKVRGRLWVSDCVYMGLKKSGTF